MDSPAVPSAQRHDAVRMSTELDALSAIEVTEVQNEIATELYGFPPLAFTSAVVDLANDVIYDVVDKCDAKVMKRWSPSSEQDDDTVEAREKREAVQKGVNRLETLLMAAVDLRFDQAEVWMLRNAFGVPENIIPYILLPHHPPDGFMPYLRKNEDDTLMRELESDIQSVNALREEEAILTIVEERLLRRNAALKQAKSTLAELMAGGGVIDTLAGNAQTLASSLPAYIAHCNELLSSMASPQHVKAENVDAKRGEAEVSTPWKTSREAYLACVVHRTARSGSDNEQESRLDSVTKQLAKQGSAQDVKALRELVTS